MKIQLISILFFSFLLLSCYSNDEKSKVINSTENISIQVVEYDSLLAKKFGADDYGMKKYVIAFLKRGPNRTQDSVKAQALQKAHMDNIGRLAEEGKLILAGPFFGNDDLRGIYIFNVSSIVEAEKLTNTDPAIKAGSLVMDLKEWYGSAALMEVNETHHKISKIKI